MKKTLTRLIILMLIASILFSLSSCFWFVERLEYADGKSYVSGSTRFDKSNLATDVEVVINWLGGSVSVLTTDGDEVVIEEKNTTEINKQNSLHTYYDGKTLHIRPAESGTPISEIPGKSLTVYVPESLSLGSLIVTGTTADVSVGGVSAKAMYVKVDVGSLNLGDSNVTERIEYVMGSGDAFICPANMPNRINVTVGNGNTDLILPRGEGFTLGYHAVSGDFISEYTEKLNGGSLVVGDGSKKISYSVDSGNLYLGKRD